MTTTSTTTTTTTTITTTITATTTTATTATQHEPVQKKQTSTALMGLCPFWQPGCFFPNKYCTKTSTTNTTTTNTITTATATYLEEHHFGTENGKLMGEGTGSTE